MIREEDEEEVNLIYSLAMELNDNSRCQFVKPLKFMKPSPLTAIDYSMIFTGYSCSIPGSPPSHSP